MIEQSIICAPATAVSGGAIAIIRVSGEGSIKLVDSIFKSPSGKSLAEADANTIHFGNIIDQNGGYLDEVLVSIFRNPHSFTGEDSVEISCHASSYIVREVTRILVERGALIARPGEFTKRAFANGKMDLSQAEAIADLIASSSEASHRIAMGQMRGGFSKKLSSLRDHLLHLVTLLELELDFPEEDVEFANRAELKSISLTMSMELETLINSFAIGNVMKNGIPVAIIGETNVGKSTLLNLFLDEEKAIVSDIHGTTRDIIEDTKIIDGVTFRFIDTAGIRQTSDKVEQMGIERSFAKIDLATIIIWVIDLSSDVTNIKHSIRSLSDRILKKKTLILFNKSDLVTDERKTEVLSLFESFDVPKIIASVKKELNTKLLQEELVRLADLPEIKNDDVIVSNARHYEALVKAKTSIDESIIGFNSSIPSEFIVQDIHECLHHLGEITGKISSDEVLHNIFKNFCIGK